MLEVDPYADKSATIAIGIEPSSGETPEKMTLLGTDNVLDQKTLTAHYDALGAYLHTPTIEQIEAGKTHKIARLRKRCGALVESLEKVLSSTVWNSTIANRGEIKCMDCGETINRRMIDDGEPRRVECWKCNASYDMRDAGNHKVEFDPRQAGIPCPGPDCDEVCWIWERDYQVGVTWNCASCGIRQKLAMGVTLVAAGAEEED